MGEIQRPSGSGAIGSIDESGQIDQILGTAAHLGLKQKRSPSFMKRGSQNDPGINGFTAGHCGYAAVSKLAWSLLGSCFAILPINDFKVLRRDALGLPAFTNIIETLFFFIAQRLGGYLQEAVARRIPFVVSFRHILR